MKQDLSARTPPQQHRAFVALRQPGYGAYLGGSMLAMMADSIEHVISYWMIYEKFHSPALGGFAVISHWLPSAVLDLVRRAADRFDARRIIQFGMLLFMICSLGWGILFLTDTLRSGTPSCCSSSTAWQVCSGTGLAAARSRHRRP
jgi:hypothetical protein